MIIKKHLHLLSPDVEFNEKLFTLEPPSLPMYTYIPGSPSSVSGSRKTSAELLVSTFHS